MGVTVSLYLDERVKKKYDFYPLKLRVTHDRERTYISIDTNRINKLLKGRLEDYRYIGRESYSITKSTFEKIIQQKPRGIYKDLQVIFKSFELEYQQLADNIKPFTIEKFKELYNENNKKSKNDIFSQIEIKIEVLKSEGRYNSATAYTSLSKSLEKFNKRKNECLKCVWEG